jgi:hypothetical protein
MRPKHEGIEPLATFHPFVGERPLCFFDMAFVGQIPELI